MQYGVNIAVLDKAKDGSWGKIAVWNAMSLGKLSMEVNSTKDHHGQKLVYELKVRNISPAPQRFAVSDPIPANTTFVGGRYFDAATNSIEWTGELDAHETKVIVFSVKVNPGTPKGTKITNTATLSDDASGSSASATTMVK